MAYNVSYKRFNIFYHFIYLIQEIQKSFQKKQDKVKYMTGITTEKGEGEHVELMKKKKAQREEIHKSLNDQISRRKLNDEQSRIAEMNLDLKLNDMNKKAIQVNQKKEEKAKEQII